jgi:hypothetical protein
MGRTLTTACLAFLAILVTSPSGSAAICTSASGCEFWDNDYHELILYEVDTGQIDVLIVPPASGTALWDLPAIEQGIAAWDAGIDALGPAWLANGVNIDSYVVGVDVPPQAALLDPEILVYSAAFNPFVLFGIGLQAPFSVCREQSSAASVAHQHLDSDWLFQPMACEDGGIQCHVINTNFLTGTTRQMYDLNAHEVGHCLGIGHVGDALDFDAKTVPLQDIMSYQNNPNQVHCVSSLNILALQAVYEPVLGVGPGQPPMSYVHMSPASYTQVGCTNPADGLWVSASMDAEPMQPVESVQELGLLDSLGAAAWTPEELLADSPLGRLL